MSLARRLEARQAERAVFCQGNTVRPAPPATEKPRLCARDEGGAGSFNQCAGLIPTRCRDLYLKQFCLDDFAPATLIILITHIIIAVRWMLIKILSVVINGQRSHKVIVPGGCYLDINYCTIIQLKNQVIITAWCIVPYNTHQNLLPVFLLSA